MPPFFFGVTPQTFCGSAFVYSESFSDITVNIISSTVLHYMHACLFGICKITHHHEYTGAITTAEGALLLYW